MSDRTRPIVVGIDGSEGGLAAARWAAALATRMDAPLRLLHARPDTGHALTDAAAALRAAVGNYHEEQVERSLAEAAEAAQAESPGLSITTAALECPAAEGLIDASWYARFVVLGTKPVTPLAALLLGSTTLAVATGAGCPVIIVRGADTAATDAPVVVGVDYSETGGVALERAFEMADRLGVGLTAVHAWSHLVPAGVMALPRLTDWAALESAELVQLTEVVDEVAQRFPNVKAKCFLESDRPAEALIQHSDGARMVVVGSRGRGALTGAVFGSTGLNMLQHCRIPLMICHEGHTVP
ncbi:universal stress protein [Mycolicibacterium confluentis]|uniref:Universal stress protein n=1 Tax=Mycolicibacterium confluentis TaxID=28047 RepID=A0A7I7XUT0_9MYCO|nr:universal stress protein [Mycolicibacterium confluentis]MCV7322287.1 universal stress protein [Mycolicibacterium confluentis]ORV28391.1 hypothetical protein AWB99_17810 [Mycolicibacterium confluentis]BBZ33029.1 universal stress protein [Mycolicibacterium confluentis]